MHISPIFLMNNVENPRITEWTSTNVERSHRLPHVYTKMMYGKLGGIACRKNIWSTWLQSRGCTSFLIRHLRYRTLGYLRRCYWKKCFANLFFPTASMHSQLVGQPPLHSHSTASSPAPGRTNPNAMALSSSPAGTNLCQKECQKNASLPIYLPIYLSVCLSIWLAS